MSDTPPQRFFKKRYLPIVALGLALGVAVLFRLHEIISLQTLYARAQELDAMVARNLVLALAAYVVAYAVGQSIFMPGAGLFTITGGFLFGTLLGGAGACIALIIGGTVNFLAARTAFGDILRARAGSWIEKLRDGFRDNAFNYILALRLTPLFPFLMISIVPAFFDVKLRDYVLATAIGVVPGTLVYAAVGAGLKAALVAGATADPGQVARSILTAPAVFGPIIALILLALAPVVIKAVRARRTATAV